MSNRFEPGDEMRPHLYIPFCGYGTGLHLWMVGDAIHSFSSYIHHPLGFKQQPSCWKCLCYASFIRQNTMSAGFSPRNLRSQ